MRQREPLWSRPEFGLWMLAPHGLSCVAFVAGIAIVAVGGTNRLDIGQAVGLAGFLALALSLPATLLACLHAILSHNVHRRWLAPVLHAAALSASFLLGAVWFSLHLV